MSKSSGFTLIELLIVIAIVSILATVGFVIYSGSQKSARDSRRRTDIDSIAKAYEVKYLSANKYLAVVGSDFSQGSIPKDPDGVTDYYQGLASDGSSFKVCAALEANPTRNCSTESATCICKNSTISTIATGATLDQITGGATPTPGPTGAPTVIPTPTCTPPGTLASGLVNSWKMNESPQTSPLNDSVGASNLTVNGPSTNAVAGKVSNGHSFNGAFPGGDHLNTTSSVFPTGASAWNDFSVSIWVKPTTLAGQMMLLVQEASTSRAGDISISKTTSFGDTLIFDRLDGGASRRLDRVYIPSSSLTANVWNHLVFTWTGGDNGTGRIYVNAVSQTVTSVANSTGGGSWNLPNLFIGGGYPGSPWQFSGVMDEAGIWNRALSAGEVSTLHTRYQNNCSL